MTASWCSVTRQWLGDQGAGEPGEGRDRSSLLQVFLPDWHCQPVPQCGIFTRDFRENELSRQILVTVPQCFGILLMSGENVSWLSRVQTVILDEVHSIGEKNGEIWEQIILMIQCPFIALSATLGNTDYFASWLREVEKQRGRELYVVRHSQRYNDLRQWVYVPEGQGGLTSERGALKQLHPFVCMEEQARMKRIESFPSDLKLLPEHCLDIYRAMALQLSDSPELADLEPNLYFKRLKGPAASWNSTLTETTRREGELKARVCQLTQQEQLLLIQKLAGPSLAHLRQVDEDMGRQGERNNMKNHLMSLVQQLRARGMLPAILFHMNRAGCNHFAKLLCELLAQQEDEHKRLKKFPEQVKALRREHAGLVVQLKNLGYNDDYNADDNRLSLGVRDRISQLLSELGEVEGRLRDLEGMQKEFILIPDKSHLSDEEICDAMSIDSLEDAQEDWMVRTLKRGIAVHHSGTNRKYRQAVESLFRMKKIGLIVATATLAVGINMPCRCSVFVGDAIYINGMNFRQMSGRAGRRGFDLRGDVVFYFLPSNKINRLLSSELPALVGNRVISSSTILRLILRHGIVKHESSRAGMQQNMAVCKMGIEAVSRLIKYPLFKLNHLMADQAANSVAFCIEYLFRLDLITEIDNDVTACDMGALATHLFYAEPANFALVALLRTEALKNICLEAADGQLELLSILCNLFCCIPLEHSLAEAVKTKKIAGPSKVLLEPLHPDLVNILERRENERAMVTLPETTGTSTSGGTSPTSPLRPPSLCLASSFRGQMEKEEEEEEEAAAARTCWNATLSSTAFAQASPRCQDWTMSSPPCMSYVQPSETDCTQGKSTGKRSLVICSFTPGVYLFPKANAE